MNKQITATLVTISLIGCADLGEPAVRECTDSVGATYTATAKNACFWHVVDSDGYVVTDIPDGFRCKEKRDGWKPSACVSIGGQQ